MDAEAFASKNKVLDSALDGLGMGLGIQFLSLLCLVFDSCLQQELYLLIIHSMQLRIFFTLKIIPDDFTISMFSQPVGAFCTFACLAAGLAAYKSYQTKKAAEKQKGGEIIYELE